MAGGFACLANTQTPLGTSVDMLQHSPFTSFLIPGLLLFLVIGVGNCICSILLVRNWKYWDYSSTTQGCALMIWIGVQCLMLQTVVFLHVLFFVLGLLQTMIAGSWILKQNHYPYQLFASLLKKPSKK
jgi:hypothetical protein